MSGRQDHLDWLLHSSRQITASKKVWQFVVGITSDRHARRNAYRRWARANGGQLDGFVLLEWDQTPDDAVATERFLFENLVNDDRYGVIKMHYHPSVNRRSDQHDVYLAWWSKWLVHTDDD